MIAFAVAAAVPVPKSSAASVDWDGKTDLKSGNTYRVTSEITVRKNIAVPENARLYVLDGGKLIIPQNTSVSVYGEMAVAIGGNITVSGELSANPGASVGVYGELWGTLGSKTDIMCDITVYNRGELKSSGIFNLYKDANLTNKNKAVFTKSSAVKSSGNISNSAGASFETYGSCSVTVSGVMTSNGTVLLGQNCAFYNSGNILLERGSSYCPYSQITNTESGVLINRSGERNYESMTAYSLSGYDNALLYGIDVSVHNGDIDWYGVANSGIDFAMIRAGRGNASLLKPMAADDNFCKNVQGANENGIAVGVYFYSYAKNIDEIQAEARYLVEILRGNRITYPVALDMEENMVDKGQTAAMIEAFFKIVMDAGYFPMLYSYTNWFESNLDGSVLDKYAVWVAETKEAPTYKRGYYMWQYSHTARVFGIDGAVDMNVSYRDFSAIIRANKLNNL